MPAQNQILDNKQVVIGHSVRPIVKKESKNDSVDLNKIINKYKGKEISVNNLHNLLKDLKVKHSEIVLKQAILESDKFTSKLFKSGNNLFGMKRPTQRISFALKRKICGYASFRSWQHCAADYKLWQDMVKIEGDYYKYLIRRGYAADLKYVRKLKYINLEN